MATYTFETMSQADATGFTSDDTLIFSSTSATPANVTVTENATTTTLSSGGKSLTFAQSALLDADLNFTSSFNSGSDSHLIVGTSGDDAAAAFDDFGTDGDYAYGLAGEDTLTGGAGDDNIFGGDDGDVITGGAGNDHIYGFGLTGDPSTDEGDNIDGEGGNDYIQGNAGEDTLDGDAGNDRVNGGGDDDTITGGDGKDTVNGNKGEDVIDGGLDNDSVRGGQDDDSVSGGDGNDIVQGDLGDDTVVGGADIDLLSGGAGADVFQFADGDAAYETDPEEDTFGLVDVITDFASGDKLDIDLTLTDIAFQASGVTFTEFGAAESYAQGLYDAGGNVDTVVYAIQVGADTYLFYDDTGAAGTQLNSAIKLDGIDADAFFDPDAPNGRFVNA